MKKNVTKSVEIGGRTLTLKTGQLASQADGAVLAQYGETVVLATVVASAPREDLGYFPLSVEYVERLYAGGRIKGSRWVKREGRPSDEAVLAARLIDRSIRPLFPKGYFNEVQVMITVLSVDMENNPEVLAVVAASAVLSISPIPWEGPVGVVSVGLREGKCFVNPANGEAKDSDLELTVSATKDACLMLEAEANEVVEEEILKAILFGQKEAGKVIGLIEDLVKEVGTKKDSYVAKKVDPEVKKQILKLAGSQIENLLAGKTKTKLDKEDYEELKAAISENLTGIGKGDIEFALEEILKEKLKKRIFLGKRLDGRKIDEVRSVGSAVGLLPRTHGSGLFNRGETQVLTVTTLGSHALEQLIEGPEGEVAKRFMHHYSMPPYSVGEAGRVTGPSRREIGHGALAEKAILPVIPSSEKFPYTIMLVSEVLSSNGSTSMASACGATLSLMDAGVPITSPVSGLAFGLFEDGEKFVVLTDITGLEDMMGFMDFKVAGTQKGVTAIQLDVKNHGLKEAVLKEVMKRALKGRELILKAMTEVIDKPREKTSQYAPKVAILSVPVEKIGEVIGPGGRMIKKIISDTGAIVDVEDDGQVHVSGLDEEAVKKAVEFIKNLIREVQPGEIFEGEVKRVEPFGAFVEVLPGKDGLVHVSRMSEEYVDDPSKLVSVGQKVKVKVTEIDDQKRIALTMLLESSPNSNKQNRGNSSSGRGFSPQRSRNENLSNFKRSPFSKPQNKRR